MTWKVELAGLIAARWRVGQSFSLSQLYELEIELRGRHPTNDHIRDKIRQTLQYLRDEGMISFVDGSGTYLRLG
jgi:hypothetical protein